MNNDFDIESLSKTWQTQPVPNSFNAKQIKRRLVINRLSLLAISLVELFIILAVVWLLTTAFTQSWAIHVKVWLIFGLISGVLAMIPLLKSRITSYKMISSSTSDWINFENKMSIEALHRGRLTNYLILAFSAAILIVFSYELLILESPLRGLALRYCFGIVWLVAGWFINRHQMKKHQNFLNTLK